MQHACRTTFAALLTTCALGFATPAAAQSGILDQLAPDLGATFNVGSNTLTWQQEVRSELGGRVTDIEVTVQGTVGSSFDLRLRAGEGWNTSEVVFTASVSLLSNGVQNVLVDVSAANLVLGVGEAMVIELQGSGSSAFARGSYIDPASGSRAYEHPFFLNQPGCYNDCGWRLAFRMFIDPMGGAFNYCTSTPNSTGSPALLSLQGSTSLAANDAVLVAQPTPNEPGLFVMGRDTTNLPLGPGTLCVALPFHRLQFAFGVNNVMSFPVDLGTLPPAYVVAAGEVWNFQAYYRDPVTADGFNLSDALHVLFVP